MPFLRYTLALLAGYAGLAAATTRTWPGAAPCNDTLQACIDAASDGDRIEIATDTPITENITMHNRRLTLTAADGHKPAFQGHGVLANNSGSDGDIELRLSRIRFENGFVTATYSGTGTATFDLRGLEITRAPGATGNGIQIVSYGGTVEAMLYDNRVSGQPLSLNSGLVRLAAEGGTLNAAAYYNRVGSTSSASVDGAGFFVDYSGGTSGGTVKLHANDVRGSFNRAGIFLSEGLSTLVGTSYEARIYSNVVVGSGSGSGITVTPKTGRIDVQLVNNTVTRVQSGISAVNWNGGKGAEISGLVINNLVRAERAMFANIGITTELDNDYNLFNGATLNVTPGAHTITAPAALVSDEYPRLRADSPARDAGDTTTFGFGLILNRLPFTDADGLRRLKLEDVDIGAHEFGDASFLHTAAAETVSNHVSWIDDPAVNGAASANLFVTPNYDVGLPSGGVSYNQPFGTWYASGNWSVFNEDTAIAMPLGAHFDVFAAAAGSGVFRHRTSADSVSGWTSRLDDGSLNDLPDRIVLATQNYSAGGVYNAHPIGVFYLAFGGPGSWHLANIDLVDGGDMPVGAGFSVYAQEPSPNAFRIAATPANRPGSSNLYLDHPLLNDMPCAQPLVTRLFDGTPASSGFDIDYDDGRWSIYTYDDMPLGAEFNVMINPAQAFECRDRIFADRFD